MFGSAVPDADDSGQDQARLTVEQEVAKYFGSAVSAEDGNASYLEFWVKHNKVYPRLARVAYKLSVIQVRNFNNNLLRSTLDIGLKVYTIDLTLE